LQVILACYLIIKVPSLNVDCYGHENHEKKNQKDIGLSLNSKHKTKEPK
jgi:hypothetical protein